MSILATMLPALIPFVGDGIRGVFAKFTGGAGGNPVNVEEKISLMQAETEKLKAIAEIDSPSGKASTWVYNLRESSRYLAVFVVILNAGLQSMFNDDPAIVVLSLEMASSGFFFLFGDRVHINLRGKN